MLIPVQMDQEMLPGKGKELEHLQQGAIQEHKPWVPRAKVDVPHKSRSNFSLQVLPHLMDNMSNALGFWAAQVWGRVCDKTQYRALEGFVLVSLTPGQPHKCPACVCSLSSDEREAGKGGGQWWHEPGEQSREPTCVLHIRTDTRISDLSVQFIGEYLVFW